MIDLNNFEFIIKDEEEIPIGFFRLNTDRDEAIRLYYPQGTPNIKMKGSNGSRS